VARGDLVVDVGAGCGALTAPLLARGARVVAIEVDPAMLRELTTGAASRDRLEVVRGDALEVPLPTEPFRVVANPPFGLTTSLLRRLLGGDAPLRDATLVLQRETAQRVSGAPTVGRSSLGWAPWFEMRVVERIDRRAFRPVPAADAAVLQVRPRAVPWLSPARYADWDHFVDRVFRASGRTAADRLDVVLGARAARRIAAAAEVDPVRPPSRLPAEAWLALFRSLPPRS
jgi:23S rRNA (adenine-N6)-dimethyltransferase